MKQLTLFAQALADETRWRILQLLKQEVLCVCELADILGMPQSSVSSQIQVIKKAGLLEHEKCGKWIYYHVAPSFQPLLCQLGERFGATETQVAQLAHDRSLAAQRLLVRDQSCCPLPSKLCSIS